MMDANKFKMMDGGTREVFPSGSMREPDDGKPRYSLIPPGVLKRVAMVLTNGAKKYAPWNWLGLPTSRSLDSAMRHLEQFRAGETDEDHLAQAVANIFFIMHKQGTQEDDIFDWNAPQESLPEA